jgi:hypothetical protein
MRNLSITLTLIAAVAIVGAFVLPKQDAQAVLRSVGAAAAVNPTSVTLTGGTIDGVVIGGTVPAAGSHTTLTASGTVSGAGFNAYLASPPAIGGTAAAAATHTTLVATTSVSTPSIITGANLTIAPVGATTAITGTVTVSAIAANAAAQTGYLCYNTSGGVITYDSGATCLVSSERYKKNVRPLEASLRKVMALTPVSYQLRDQYNPSHQGRQVGFVAEDVVKVEPRLVPLDADGKPRAVEYMQMTALLVKAIQEQQAQIDQMKSEIRELKAVRTVSYR